MERTPAYRFTTTDRNDPRIIALRAETRASNKAAHKEGLDGHRVHVKGRAGPNNPNVTRLQLKDGSVPLGVATRFDVYLHSDYHGHYSRYGESRQEHLQREEIAVVQRANTEYMDQIAIESFVGQFLDLVIKNARMRGIQDMTIGVAIQTATFKAMVG